MYQRKSSGFSIFRVILFGMVAGIAFFAYDTWRSGQETSPAPADVTVNSSPTNPQTVSQDTPVDTSQTATGDNTAVNTIPDYVSPIAADAEIFIPSVSIIAPITQAYLDGTSWDVSHLGTSVGHLQGTSWVSDAPGNIVLSGHVELSDGRRGVFAELDEVQVGERIIVTQNGEERVYIVVAVNEVEPEDLTPLYPTEFERLTLITCGGYDFFSDEYEIRTVVVADRVS